MNTNSTLGLKVNVKVLYSPIRDPRPDPCPCQTENEPLSRSRPPPKGRFAWASEDHKPSREDEVHAVIERGGEVIVIRSSRSGKDRKKVSVRL